MCHGRYTSYELSEMNHFLIMRKEPRADIREKFESSKSLQLYPPGKTTDTPERVPHFARVLMGIWAEQKFFGKNCCFWLNGKWSVLF